MREETKLKLSKKAFERLARNWLITTPSGEKIQIRGLKEFCKTHNLSPCLLGKVAKGKTNNHKGWKCQQL